MATKTILDSTLTAIADAIRQKTGDSGSMTPLEMPEEIENIPTGGGGGDTLADIYLNKTATSYINNNFSGAVQSYALYYAPNTLTEVKIPHATSLGSSAMAYCFGLRTIDFSEVTDIGSSAFYGSFSSSNGGADISFPVAEAVRSNAFNGAQIKSIDLPSVTTVENSAFTNCNKLTTITFPNDLTTFGNSPLRNCTGLESVIFGGDVSGINSYAFGSCSACLLYDFSHCTVVPALANTNAFTGINANAKIVVPDALYNDWIAASNWATLASHIVKASEA